MKHLQHLKHRLTTCVFRPSPMQRRAERGTVMFGQPVAEADGAAWLWSAAPVPRLGSASDGLAGVADSEDESVGESVCDLIGHERER
jgi:hypothetical protein